VRSSKLPNAHCDASQQLTLAAAYVEQARSMEKTAKELSVGFVEHGECKPANASDATRIAKNVPQAVWYCTVTASPD